MATIHPTAFLDKCCKCEYYNLKTCHSGSCTKGHITPCTACGILKGSWDQQAQKFMPLGDPSIEECKDYEPMKPGNTNKRWLS